MAKTAAKSLYVCRPLTNAAEVHKWAAEQGFKPALAKDDLHVTIAYSREPVNWSKLEETRGSVRVNGGKRSIEKLGDAVVLRFASPTLKERWQQIRDAGASWDHPGYKPHITITYKGAPSNLEKIEPYSGPLVFGPERFDEVNEDAKDEVREVKMADTLTQANNVKVKFRGQPERNAMPMESKAQNAAMHSAAEGKSTLGIPKSVGKKFVSESHGQNVKALPAHVKKKASGLRKRGLISDRVAEKMGMS